MYNLINTPPREDQCEWHRMTRMTGPDCVVMCNLINTHTHTHSNPLSNMHIISVPEELILLNMTPLAAFNRNWYDDCLPGELI